jgi:hypothetical protein
MREIRHMGKLIDEPAKGKAMEKIPRKDQIFGRSGAGSEDRLARPLIDRLTALGFFLPAAQDAFEAIFLN